jgi:hypothetical protein
VATAKRDGVATVSPSQATTYRLDATSAFGTASREIDVGVIAPGAPPPTLGGSIADPNTKCENGRLTIPVEAKTEYWDSHIAAAGVVAEGDRPLRVEHGGATAELDPGGASDSFASVPVQGTWILSTALRDGESCGPSLPRLLAVKIVPKCSP